MKKKLLSLFMCTVMITTMLSGCKGEEEGAQETSSKDGKYDEFITVDVFDTLSNYQGTQSGWFAKIVKDKFNMELNIIAPNVAGGGDTLYQTRSAAGNLGDLIICGTENGKFQDMVTAGLLADMSELLKDKDVMKKYGTAIEDMNTKVQEDGIYGIPSKISSNSATTPSEGLELTYGPYLRWDLYKELGYPEIGTLEDLLPILKDMQELARKEEPNKKIYSLSLFKDWDGNMMNNAKQPACLYGYDELGFVLAKADGSDYQSIIEDDSMYVRVLKFFYEANQMGLVDPESTTQNYDTLSTKYKEGKVLYSPWPWLGQSYYNTEENVAEGKGFEIVPIDDMKIISNGCMPQGLQKTIIAIGSQAKDKQRLADFIDWLYSPEGIQIQCAQDSGAACGPEGLTWEQTEDGPVLTDFGKKAFYNSEVTVPDEWGGGTWKDGKSFLNFKPVSDVEKDDNGVPYFYNQWDSVINMHDSALSKDWKEHMDADTTMEYLEKNDKILVAPGNNYIQPDEGSEISTLRSQCKGSIVDYSWKMVFAKNEAEFNRYLKEMQKTVKGLGYDDVLKVDMKNAKDQNAAREKSASIK